MERQPSPVFEIRQALASDEPFLRDMLFEALFAPPGSAPIPRSALDTPEVSRYVDGFGPHPGDVGFVAIADDQPIGAVWVRSIQGYGHIDDQTPELTIAVTRDWRGQGVGTALMARITELVPRISLSSDILNPSIALYKRFGFEIVDRVGTSVTMLRRATPRR